MSDNTKNDINILYCYIDEFAKEIINLNYEIECLKDTIKILKEEIETL
jgi:archaellum component FlaC